MDSSPNTAQAAWDILTGLTTALGTLEMPLEDAAGLWLADPVVADRDIPPAPRAAMDGFAVRAEDLERIPARLKVVGEVAAGSADNPRLARGTCVRIFTGANLPADGDLVVPVEQTSSGSFRDRPEDADIDILAGLKSGANVFRQGENARAGEELLAAGTRLGPRQLAVAAAVGRGELIVHRTPRVRILNTGGELLETGQQAAGHQTRNSNGPLLRAAITAAGFGDVPRETVPDSARATAEALSAALAGADAVVLTGGISAGRYDFVPEAVAAVGCEIAFHSVAMKPGKPQLFARTGAGGYVFGLPGNPLSVIVGLYEFVLPALRRLAGCPIQKCRPELVLPLGGPVQHGGDRLLVLPAVLRNQEGETVVLPRPSVGSADMVTGGQADGAILLPPATGKLKAGQRVRFRPWGWMEP